MSEETSLDADRERQRLRDAKAAIARLEEEQAVLKAASLSQDGKIADAQTAAERIQAQTLVTEQLLLQAMEFAAQLRERLASDRSLLVEAREILDRLQRIRSERERRLKDIKTDIAGWQTRALTAQTNLARIPATEPA